MFDNLWVFIFAWYNVPFTFLLGLSILFAAFQLIGLGGDQEGDSDLDHDADLEQDIDHDLDHDVDQEVDHETDHDSNPASSLTLLAFLGVGKAPLMVVLLLLFSSVGVLGWTLNGLVETVFGTYHAIALVGVLPAALLVGGSVSARTARLIGRALPPISTTATDAQALVGRIGTVISPLVDDRYGQIHLRNAGGTLISVFAVTQSEAPLKRGEVAVLADYDAGRRRYIVTRAKSL